MFGLKIGAIEEKRWVQLTFDEGFGLGTQKITDAIMIL